MSTATGIKAPSTFVGKAADYLDQRAGLAGLVKEFGRKVFPDHWSFMLGEVALYSFVALILSGTFLTLFFEPSMAEVEYHGSYAPMAGQEMSAAYASALHISFDVRGGLLMRQLHHWAALMFIAAAGLHMLRVFFTGAFRKPREINWIVGFTLFLLAMIAGFTGYSLPDDLLSGNGLRIVDGILKAVPIAGSWLSFLMFGGEFPGTVIISRLYMAHIMLIPALIIALIGLHLIMVVVHKHTQYPGPGRTDGNVVGYPLLPVYAGKAGGFFFIVFGVLVLISTFFTINPIWSYGPYDPSPVSAGTQPDWYIGPGDGALRLMPPHIESVLWGWTFSWNILIPMLVFLLVLVAAFLYPFIEAWVTGDKREHHVLDRPRNAPTRTAIGAALMTEYAVLWGAASSDLMATHFHADVFLITHLLQALVFVGPVVAYFVTKRICLGLQKKDREIVLHGVESGEVVRLPGGEYTEVHTPLDEYTRWRLVSFERIQPLNEPHRQPDGRIRTRDRLRAALSRWFYEDRVSPVAPSELEDTHSAQSLGGTGGQGELPDAPASSHRPS